MKKIRFGIIGCGNVTEKKSGPAFQKIEGSELYAVMRRDAVKVKDYAERHGVERYSTDYRELLEDPAIDAIYVATPPDMHRFYAVEAARHGKAVYVEKPMARTVAECHEMIEACQEYGVPLFVAYYRRGQPKFRKVKELVESGALGEVRSFNYQYASPVPQEDPERAWLYDKSVAGGGKLYDVGSHMIDIMLFFFGDVRSAAGVSSNQSGAYEINDNTSGILCFRSGVQGTLQMTFNGLRRYDEMTIVGSEGTLVFSIMSNDPLLLYRGGGEVETYAFEPLEHVQLPLITRVVRTLQGQDDLPADGTYGLRTQEILEALENSETLTYE